MSTYRSTALAALLVILAIGMVYSLFQLPPLFALVFLGSEAIIAVLVWELVRSRRKLVQEHAAHMAKSAYLANFSHELRTPLNAILGFSEILKGEMMGPMGTRRYVEYSGDIHYSARHLLDLIDDVLELSRLEAGRLELHEDTHDLGPILLSCQRLLGERARRAGVALDLDTGTPVAVLCDRTKVKQVMLNLLTNAVKFTPRGGTVSVRVRREGGAVAIDVADTGIGIPVHEIPRVMTPFLQAAHTHVLTDEGTGLGLPLAKRLMELHGGGLHLTSEVGVGTTVTVTFPSGRCPRQDEEDACLEETAAPAAAAA
ncbi:HAMP domain-containing sensor histidine kinase [Magnetospirillum sp. UT-4]|uniref:sensor histidine kinase n=1 Tax=Magnetospirillum sp. UT-4 TaxID=2681467 RepID=UPI00137D95BB|nr:HAMP domain-containing sensor histidine kinase [Magnetospirillum sp. UT-4]CAA7613575.1 putative Histidine kinase [Magnetospirillum sp. UT-4]